MIDINALFASTDAYKTVACDKRSGRLSHAYLILTADKANILNYLKILAKSILADGDERKEELIDKGIYADAPVYPASGEVLLKEDIASIIEESYLKPIEGDKKVFILNAGDNIPPTSQNKLLKTLEEPPNGVHILIGATSEFSLLATVRSRLKKLVIPPYADEVLFDALKEDCPSEEKLKEAIACGDGTLGKALSLYQDENFTESVDAAIDMILNMRTSRNVLEYSVKISALKDGLKGFLPVLELIVGEISLYYNGGKVSAYGSAMLKKLNGADGFNAGSATYTADAIAEAQKRLSANGSEQAVTEWLLFAILEGKHKWQKL